MSEKRNCSDHLEPPKWVLRIISRRFYKQFDLRTWWGFRMKWTCAILNIFEGSRAENSLAENGISSIIIYSLEVVHHPCQQLFLYHTKERWPKAWQSGRRTGAMMQDRPERRPGPANQPSGTPPSSLTSVVCSDFATKKWQVVQHYIII